MKNLSSVRKESRLSETQEALVEILDNKNMELKLGEVLRSLLKERALTLKQVSQLCGVSISTLHEWENNRTPKNPLQVAKVARCLGISLHRLLFGIEDPEDSIGKVIKNEVFSGTYEIFLRKVKLPKS